jgi:hypothetical protein
MRSYQLLPSTHVSADELYKTHFVMLLSHSASMSMKWSDIDSQGTRCPVHYNGAASLRKVIMTLASGSALRIISGRSQQAGYRVSERGGRLSKVVLVLN